jgi:hypothetical protein
VISLITRLIVFSSFNAGIITVTIKNHIVFINLQFFLQSEATSGTF